MDIRTPVTELLKGKTALITGASRGFGLCVAENFAAHGANLLLVARNTAMLEAVEQRLRPKLNTSQTLEVFTADFADVNSMVELLNAITDTRIDILINNAATQHPMGPIWKNNWNAWESSLQINLLAPVMLSRAIVACMIKHHQCDKDAQIGASGKIINMSGGGATYPRPNFSAYAVAKAGLVRFTETLAEEVANYHIAVNCIAPGAMPTDMQRDIVEAGESEVGMDEFTRAQSILNDDEFPLLRATELCLYLASSLSDGITGKLISAAWDPWKNFSAYTQELRDSDIYTLRRIVPNDRGKKWSE